MRLMVGMALLAALSGCGGDEPAGGVTAEESQQLNEAAAMLDSNSDTLIAADETGLTNGEGAAADANATLDEQ